MMITLPNAIVVQNVLAIVPTIFDNKWFWVYNSFTLNQRILNMSEQEQNQVKMFGCTSAELKESVERSTTWNFDGAAMVVASMLSDAQEELVHGMNEEARQTLNRAKFVLFEYLKPARS